MYGERVSLFLKPDLDINILKAARKSLDLVLNHTFCFRKTEAVMKEIYFIPVYEMVAFSIQPTMKYAIMNHDNTACFTNLVLKTSMNQLFLV